MKQWFKKVIGTDDLAQNENQTKMLEDKNRRIVVSFQRHVENKNSTIPQNNRNFRIKQNSQQYQKDYIPRSFSNLSKCVQIDQDQEKKSFYYKKLNNKYKNKSKVKEPRNKNQVNQSMKSKQKKNKDPFAAESQSQEVQSSSESEESKDDQAMEVSQQLVNSLISMQNLIKMIKSIPQAKGQYITLKHINRFLTERQCVNKYQLSNYILSKSSQELSAYCNKTQDKGKSRAHNRFVQKLMKSNRSQPEEQVKKSDQIAKFYFRTFSNGLTHQYYPVRALIWKILSGYLPESKQKWIWKMQVSLLKYRQLVKEHIVQITLKKKKNIQKINSQKQKDDLKIDSKKTYENQFKPQTQYIGTRKKSQTFSDPLSRLNTIKKQEKDHPLNSKQNSKWKTYFQDYEIWNIIQKDTMRTRQTCSFFKQANQFSLTNQNSIESDIVNVELQNNEIIQFRLNQLHLSKNNKDCTTYVDALTRIIFIYLKVHPQQQYYQGINELVAVIYYSLTNKNNEYFRRVSESDTYQIFSLLMSQLKVYPLHNVDTIKLHFNHFISGQKYFDLLKNMIHKYDFRLHDFLAKNKGFQYLKAISLRWFLSIFLTQFSLDDALILWDSVMIIIGNKTLSSDDKRQTLKSLKLTEFILYMALGVIHLNRNQIYPEDTSEAKECSNILIVFQKIKQKPEQIIEKTITLYKSYPNLLE